MPFFDFHLHPVLKSLFSEKTETTEKFSPWDKLKESDIPFLLRWCTEFERILQSQSNLSQLVVNDCNLICVAFYIPEQAMIDNDLVLSASKGKLKDYLQENKINAIINGNPYQLLKTDDWVTLTDATAFGVSDRKVKPIFTSNDYDENDSKTIHVVFSVEGCHTLSSKLREFDADTIIQNLDDLRSKVKLLSINLTHLEQSTVCNHAFGIQFVNDDAFKPTLKGIGEIGIQVLKHCYTNKIMIDVKHMSLEARLELYKLRETEDFDNINQPIVCTHAGFTSISVKDIPDYILDYEWNRGDAFVTIYQGKALKYGYKYARPAFNTSSINLYDDDIIAILQSGGMIGLSLDKRILGFQMVEKNPEKDFPVEKEFISLAEESLFLPSGPGATIGIAFNEGLCITWDGIREAGPVNLGGYHLEHFMSHLLHLITVAKNYGYDINKALQQVCIGSDFDGLINPIDCCDTMDEIYYLQQHFEDEFVSFAKESNVSLPAGFDVKNFSADLFFNNGKNFVFSRL
jgi:microsomal dipeptidase-like Zn-dependent dipeptidase